MDENPYKPPQEQGVERDDGRETSTIRGTVAFVAILAVQGYGLCVILFQTARLLADFVRFASL